MRRLLFLFVIAFCAMASSPQYSFDEDWDTVQQFINQQRNNLLAMPEARRCHLRESLAIVAPELLRHHWLSDWVETTLLEQWYVQGGSAAADFSIGPFQMKPSFVEQLEQHILSSPTLLKTFGDLIIHPTVAGPSIRKERLRRMKQLNFQMEYAICFYAVAQECFNGLPFENEADQLRFFATAYNYGFHRSVDDIQQYTKVKAFPYGPYFASEQNAYADYSLYFFQRLNALTYLAFLPV
ncbi:MAG: hypothetical protein AAF985_10970 [Bacteroidota bacterium]